MVRKPHELEKVRRSCTKGRERGMGRRGLAKSPGAGDGYTGKARAGAPGNGGALVTPPCHVQRAQGTHSHFKYFGSRD